MSLPRSLRSRVTVAFGLLALALSALLAALAWTFVSSRLVTQRQDAGVRATTVDAEAITVALLRDRTQIPSLLDGLPDTGSSSSLLSSGGRWFTTSPTVGPRSLPAALVHTVDGGLVARQRIDVAGAPFLAVGVPLGSSVGGAYYEVFPLSDLDRTLHVLSVTLVVAALVTSLLGLAVGRFASRLALRPLVRFDEAASAVARGDLDTRLDAEGDPGLEGLAASFNRTAEALQQRVVADARFAGDVSHELRTPLTTMLNSMQVVRNREAELPPSVREPLALLHDELNRFRHLVVDLIEISRHDGGDPLVLETVHVGDLVRHAADAAAGRPVTEVDPAVRDVRRPGDKRRLERVLTNLVDNATVHGYGCVRVGVLPAPGAVRIEVDDAGPGVAPERRDRVFDRFASGGQRSSDGVGLGLSIVARHVEVHGGQVWVEERPGGGARFVVLLPVEEV
ncbi:MAG TPA: HAMP domain-containing sensor histidine kinase [Actinomycetales bacterium]|nr:HAMP domain-containing sensor histidine kinase [Actinomycetales bacterium]